MSNKDLNLEEVKQKFKEWRNSKVNRVVRIPTELLQMAAQLCKTISPYFVCEQLSIKINRLRPFLKKEVLPISEQKIHHEKTSEQFNRINKKNQSKKSFITISLPEVSSISSTSCEWTRLDGAKLKISISKEEIPTLVSAFLGGGLR